MSSSQTENLRPPSRNPLRPQDCYRRASFKVGLRVFKKVEDGEYSDGKIVVFCDQQDSTSWAAEVGKIRTGYYWYPEYAVEHLLESIEAAK